MRVLLFVVFVVTFSDFADAQVQQPIYRSKADSISYNQLQQQLSERMSPGSSADPRTIDSLRERLIQFRDIAIIGMKYRYQPDPEYTPLADIMDGSVDPRQVKQLSISGWKGKALPAAVYECTSLQRLEIIEGSFRRIPRKLNRLKNLERLAIYNHNSERRLRIARNHRVRHLIFRGDRPGLLPRNFKRFAKLDTLDLKRNRLTSFPGIQKNKHLKQLVLSENELTLKNDRIRSNTSLQHLVLQRNKIETIPASLTGFPELKKLILNYNQINVVSPELIKLMKLEELGLYQNRLTEIPPVVYQMTNLRFLDLYYNQIEKIDDQVANLQNLEVLYISSNRIYRISEKVGELRNLKELYVHHNRLSYLPESLRKLNNLEVFRINENNLVDVPEWIAELHNLKNLDISHNKIYRAPDIIRKLTKLELVALTENAWENKEQVTALADDLALKGVIVHLEQFD